MKKFLLTLVATVAIVLGGSATAQASGLDRSPTVKTTKATKATTTVDEVQVDAWHRLSGGRLAVHFNDGSSYDVRACAYEDGHRCWWDGGNRGYRRNVSKSFVSIRHHLFYLSK